MKKAKSFTDLIVWQKAHAFVLVVYKMTGEFPVEERYVLVSQIRRAVISIAANIAEGFKKRGEADKVRFLNIAHGSLEEVRYFLILSRDLNYIAEHEYANAMVLVDEVGKLINGYSSSILNSNS